jgi:O-antigen ligase
MPHLGVYGYIADYSIGPAGQWWERPFSGLGLRYSFTLAFATLAGMILHWHKLRQGDNLFQGQEILLLVFLGVIWMSSLISPDTTARYSTVDHPTVKFTKIVVFNMMMTHIITEKKNFDGLFWVLVLVSLVLGLQAWGTPRRAFQGGRLENVGGADFAESNFFAAFMAAMLPIIGIQLLRSKWWGKAICTVSAAFTANAVVLCRSRGAFVGIAAGSLVAGLFAPKRHRKKIAAGLVLGMLGGLYVSDEQFLERLTTISTEEEELDESAASRFRLWRAGMEMVWDHPLGIGIGNWYQTIGRYIPEYAGKDCHSTYVKLIAELGLQGAIVFLFILAIGVLKLRNIRKHAETLPKEIGDDFMQFSFALTVSGAILLTCGLTISMTYMEFLWILLMLPVCLRRAFENTLFDYNNSLPEGPISPEIENGGTLNT